MYKMQSCIEYYLTVLATLYPEVTELSGFASLEIKRIMMMIYLSGVIQTENSKDLMYFFDVLVNSIKKAKTDEELTENTKPATTKFD